LPRVPGYPSFKALAADRRLEAKTAEAIRHLSACDLCPRRCAVNRLAGEVGVCRGRGAARVSSFGPHFGEEAELVGRHGSGTIFLTGCNLGCCFCQNYDISHHLDGREAPAEEIASMMLHLERLGCHNINLVTPTHFLPQIVDAVRVASGEGLGIPLVYNCGGYESLEMLRLAEGVFDIYMPDFKFWSAASSETYLAAPDYPEVARAVIREMHRQVGDLVVRDGIAVRGLLVRHLVMPGHLDESREILRFLAGEISTQTFVNVMDQYRPCHRANRFPAIARPLTGEEFSRAMGFAREAGLERVCS
jgi:putative pyruvate formate lyase activating enzyme